MKKDYTKIIFLVDRSGSMSKIASDIIGGYNRYIEDQKALKHGTCDVSFYQFDTEFDTVYENVNINEVKELTDKTFVPRGSTALLDAVGQTVDSVGKHLASLAENERPEKVLFVIITDGEENSSTKFTTEQIKNKIVHQTDVYKWQFVYIGANQDAWNVGSSLGIGGAASLTYAATKLGSTMMFNSLSDNSRIYRTSNVTGSFSFNVNDINAQKSAGVIISPTYLTTAKSAS